MASDTTAVKKMGFPPQIKYIVGNELCERFSYYGMRAILVVFMSRYMMMQEERSSTVYHLFVSACYLTPILGAYLSDRFLGKYKTIMALSLIYCLGHGVLAIWEGTTAGLYWGLGLIALGSGGIKPCVSAHVGDQFDERNNHLLSKVFDIFYWSINFGAMASSLLIPEILAKYGPSVAFGIPGVLMFIATIVFWMGRKYYVHVPPTGNNGQAGFLAITFYALKNMGRKSEGQSFLDVAREKYNQEEVEGAKAVMGIIKLFILVSIFWTLFDQTGSSWVLQAEKMDRMFMGHEIQSAQLQAANPIMVLILIPLFSLVIYPAIEKLGIKVTPLRKMSAGMVLAALSFVMIGVFQMAIDKGYAVNVMWQVLPYLVITMSEVMVSITGLEFAYTQAPRAMKSTVMSFWLLTVFVGNMLVAVVNQVNVFPTGSVGYFMLFAAMMFGIALFFVWGATRYKVRNFIEKSTASVGGTATAADPA